MATRAGTENVYSYATPTRLSCLLVALASFCCLAIFAGNALSAPMYLHSISTSFEVTENVAAFPGALVAGVSMFVGPFASICLGIFGFRVVTITGGIVGSLGYSTAYFSTSFTELCILHGVVVGIGLGCISQSSMVVLNFYFTKWRRLVSCLCLCGNSVGSLFPIVYKHYIDETRAGLGPTEKNEDWRFFLLIQGGTVLLCCILGIAYAPVRMWIRCRRSTQILQRQNLPVSKTNDTVGHASTSSDKEASSAPEENAKMGNQMDTNQGTNSSTGSGTKKSKRKCCRTLRYQLSEHFDFRLFKSPTFIIFTISIVMRSFVVNVPSTYMTERFLLMNPDTTSDNYALTILGISSLVGRLTCGFISDLEIVNTTVEQNIVLLLAGTASIVSGLVHDSEEMLISFEVIYGFCQGAFNSLRMIILVDLLGVHRVNSSLGLSSLFQGFPLMIGPTLIGSMCSPVCKKRGHETPEDMDRMFIVTGCILILSAILCFPLNSVNRWEREEDLQEAEMLND